MTGWWTRRLAPPAPAGKAARDLALEGLRGICACLVLYAHATAPFERLDPGYAPSVRFWWFNLGAVAVLFFFVLSGYVIGLTVRAPFSGAQARAYLGRRLIRLVPVNTAAVLLGWILFPHAGLGTVLGNLGFLQNFRPYLPGWHVDVMPDNLNLWSLNFEALYYLAFLGVWWLAPRSGLLFCAVAACAAAAAALPGEHLVASSYAYGALYWIAGLAVAWLGPRDGGPGNWPSALLVILTMWALAPLGNLLRLAHLFEAPGSLPLPSLHRLDLLPPLVWLLLAVTGRGASWRRWLAGFCLAWASAALVRGLVMRDVAEAGAMAAYSAALALAWALFRWEPPPSALARLAPLGAISYGIYAVGFPMEFGVLRTRWLPMGGAWSYCLRALILVAATFGLAWLLERKLQPALRRAFGSAAPAGAPGAPGGPRAAPDG
ncbi:MAG TPA: acyltransferase family protein [Opitutaceae bacterium]|nr:acyltransferase family protein [Opitutaceae bacterium]